MTKMITEFVPTIIHNLDYFTLKKVFLLNRNWCNYISNNIDKLAFRFVKSYIKNGHSMGFCMTFYYDRLPDNLNHGLMITKQDGELTYMFHYKLGRKCGPLLTFLNGKWNIKSYYLGEKTVTTDEFLNKYPNYWIDYPYPKNNIKF